MYKQDHGASWFFTGALLGACLISSAGLVALIADAAEKTHPAAACADAERPSSQLIISKMMERNLVQQRHLLQYSVDRKYLLTTEEGKVRAEAEILLQYHAPSTKEYTTISESGSHMIADIVFKPLLEGEVQMSSSHKMDNSITPENYDFVFLGDQERDGRRCYAIELHPKRQEKYLFEGTMWISTDEFAPVQITGRLVKNPSWWIKNLDFVRHYQKIGDFWLPARDETVSNVRIFGKNILTIQHQKYDIVASETVAQQAPPKPASTHRPQHASILEE